MIQGVSYENHHHPQPRCYVRCFSTRPFRFTVISGCSHSAVRMQPCRRGTAAADGFRVAEVVSKPHARFRGVLRPSGARHYRLRAAARGRIHRYPRSSPKVRALRKEQMSVPHRSASVTGRGRSPRRATQARAHAIGSRRRPSNNRGEQLLAKHVISQQDFDQLQATSTGKPGRHQLPLPQRLEAARLNLEFTQVKSPIDGRVSRMLITPGNLVGTTQSVLTTVVSDNPVYAYFDADEQTYLRFAHKSDGSDDAGVHGSRR